jgi:hypothetical protein
VSAPVKMVCRTCGSENVAYDCWAEWNVAEQKWEVRGGVPFDARAYCDDCDGAAHIDEMPAEVLNGN